MQLVSCKAGRVRGNRIPFHPRDHTLADTPPLFNRKSRMLRRTLDSLNGNPDTCSLRQFDWRFRSKSAVFKNRVQQFHYLLSIAPCIPQSKLRKPRESAIMAEINGVVKCGEPTLDALAGYEDKPSFMQARNASCLLCHNNNELAICL